MGPYSERKPAAFEMRFQMIERIFSALALSAVLVVASVEPVSAAGSWHLSGGGTASISQVAFNVEVLASGAAEGSFDCLMAGRSAFVLPAFGLAHVMHVHATPSAGSLSGTVLSFAGPGRLILDGNQQLDVHVRVWADSATQRFQLTVVEVGTMPVETMLSGQFKLA